MQLVDNDSFLTQLTALFESTKDHGSIWLTHKRLTHDGEDTAMKHEESGHDDREYQCLIRATNGKTINFSTRIDPDHLPKFYAAYGSLLKSSLSTLRKRDKKKEKTRTEQAVKRKKRMTEPVVVNGPKRGAGRRKRQRQIKAAVKQQASQKKFTEREVRRKLETSA
ncbi:signal recognition particle, SRP9/SRP14 subunit [Macrolepiota fuliginosa MF-IS2]|uniref:Signal recognition particle subunit SRP14 n=1 Tax=Macrolepiota fuliginosa MF-IS2 TaxID=1400762 RepID=A0A9P5XHS7_9AGAR|nr:signal recognition particle, SRP9/SRP14 subunit [Macrolepiota fuliginosa MF-IS2]